MAIAAAFSLLTAILLILLFSHAYSWWTRAHAVHGVWLSRMASTCSHGVWILLLQ